jgi:hypothetical protein
MLVHCSPRNTIEDRLEQILSQIATVKNLLNEGTLDPESVNSQLESALEICATSKSTRRRDF